MKGCKLAYTEIICYRDFDVLGSNAQAIEFANADTAANCCSTYMYKSLSSFYI